MTTAKVVETSVTVNKSSIQDYAHSDDHAQPTYKMTPGLKNSLCYSNDAITIIITTIIETI